MGRGRLTACPAVLAGFTLILAWLRPCRAEESVWPDPPGLVSSSQQSLLEQVTELARTGPQSEAVAQLKRIADQPSALVPIGSPQSAGTQRVRVHQSLQHWCRSLLQRILKDDPELGQTYRLQWNQPATVAYDALQKAKDPELGFQALAQHHATSTGNSLAFLLTDILLENEQCLAAMQILETQFPGLTRVYLQELASEAPAVSLAWHQVYRTLEQDPSAVDSLVQLWTESARDLWAESVQVLRRQLIAAAIDSSLLDRYAVRRWAGQLEKVIEDPEARQLLMRTIAEVDQWPVEHVSDSDKIAQRFALDQWPRWQIQVDRYSNANNETPATKPPVGELQAILPYHPSIYDGKVFLHELTRIRAFQANDGQPWPGGNPELALYDSQTPGATFLPLGYPLQGSPQGQLTLYAGCLYARMGPPVTAWANRSRSSDSSSMSYLIGLNLDKQGRMLRGFPLRLSPPEFVDCELEGCPVAYRELIIAVVTQRDQANVRRSLAAFDRFNGNLVWRSQVLGSGSIVGADRANVISYTRPLVAGGLVYYCSDLGSICCLNVHNGETVWLTQYNRSRQVQTEYPRPHRFRYRDGNPCLVHEGILYCLPQDCPELIALDALSGDLVWSTSDMDVADATTWVGIRGHSLIINGDRLIWLDKHRGTVITSFPDPTTPGVINSLPQPRGLGRACIVADKVYWPTAGEVLVFSASPAMPDEASRKIAPPQLLERFSTHSRGLEGGHLISADGLLMMTTPGRLICYETEKAGP